MSFQARTLVSFCSVILWACGPSLAGASELTQTATIPLTATDWGPSTGDLVGKNPLVFQKFDTQGGKRVLDAVNVVFDAHIMNNFSMKFVTPATITDSVATGNPLSPGPSITLYQPNGTSPVLTVQSPNDPASLTRSKTYGGSPGQTLPQVFSSDLPATSPFYLAPASYERVSSTSLTSPADLARFTGAGTLGFPVSAAAFASISTSSGNGMGQVTTEGTATLTLKYQYHQAQPQTTNTPEPGALLLWGLAGTGLLAVSRSRTRG